MGKVRIVEVGPRDGLQNIRGILPTATKIKLIELLAQSGLSTIEATSFVSSRWIPQLADSKEVLQGIRHLIEPENALHFPVLVPNIKGLELAHRSGAREIAVFVSATEAFSKKNINCSVEESLVRVREVGQRAADLGLKMRGYVSCIFADPYDGPTSPSSVINVTTALLDAGCYEVSLGDTIGVGTPGDVERLLTEMLKKIPADRLAGHFHDTYGQAIANVVKSYELGIRTFDSSVGGLGGCPFAKGAKGNLSTEDLVYTLHGMGVHTGVNLDEIAKIGSWITQELKIPNGSRAGEAVLAKRMSTSAFPRTHTNPIKPALPWSVVERTAEYCIYRRGANIKIYLTRPRNGNALTYEMIQALIRLFNGFSADESISRIIISSQGKYFCTGMDLKGTATTEQMFSALKTLFQVIDCCPKTTIAAINGPCLGGGVGLAFVCDIRLAISSATFRLSEVRLGLCPATISKYVIREWGFSFSRAAILSAQVVEPLQLESLGTLYKVVRDAESLELELEKLMDQLRFSAPRASSLSKELLGCAWTDPGGEEQARAIENSFKAMMAEGSESKFALQQFRRGVKGVDWDARAQKRDQSKL